MIPLLLGCYDEGLTSVPWGAEDGPGSGNFSNSPHLVSPICACAPLFCLLWAPPTRRTWSPGHRDSAAQLPTFPCWPQAQQMPRGKQEPPGTRGPLHVHPCSLRSQTDLRLLCIAESSALSQDPWLFPPKIVKCLQEDKCPVTQPTEWGFFSIENVSLLTSPLSDPPSSWKIWLIKESTFSLVYAVGGGSSSLFTTYHFEEKVLRKFLMNSLAIFKNSLMTAGILRFSTFCDKYGNIFILESYIHNAIHSFIHWIS